MATPKKETATTKASVTEARRQIWQEVHDARNVRGSDNMEASLEVLIERIAVLELMVASLTPNL